MLDVNVELPIAYVNQEARSIALAWAQKHGFKPQRRKDQYLGFVRPFDVDRDALYLGPHQLEECFYEVFNALMAPEMENIPVSCGCAVKTLAISEKVARDPETLSWLREVVDMCMMNVKELLVIVGSSDSDFEEAIRQRRFGFTSAPMDELSWNKETRRFKFEAEEFDDLYGDRTLSRFVENSHGDLDFEHGFKIRPILAVQEQTREL